MKIGYGKGKIPVSDLITFYMLAKESSKPSSLPPSRALSPTNTASVGRTARQQSPLFDQAGHIPFVAAFNHHVAVRGAFRGNVKGR